MSPDLTPQLMLAGYARGIFPMGESRTDDQVHWLSPHRRGVVPLDAFRISRRLARTVRQGRMRVTCDHAFPAVVEACAGGSPERPSSWINRPIFQAYMGLYRMGHAHSIECWLPNGNGGLVLAGGLYGVTLGAAYFGESMFSRVRDASKIALVHLVARLRAGGYRLLDTQFLTPHLASLGAVEVGREAYLKQLEAAIVLPGDFAALPAELDGATAVSCATAAD